MGGSHNTYQVRFMLNKGTPDEGSLFASTMQIHLPALAERLGISLSAESDEGFAPRPHKLFEKSSAKTFNRGMHQILATPVSLATLITASATVFATLLSRAGTMMFSSVISSSGIKFAKA